MSLNICKKAEYPEITCKLHTKRSQAGAGLECKTSYCKAKCKSLQHHANQTKKELANKVMNMVINCLGFQK